MRTGTLLAAVLAVSLTTAAPASAQNSDWEIWYLATTTASPTVGTSRATVLGGNQFYMTFYIFDNGYYKWDVVPAAGQNTGPPANWVQQISCDGVVMYNATTAGQNFQLISCGPCPGDTTLQTGYCLVYGNISAAVHSMELWGTLPYSSGCYDEELTWFSQVPASTYATLNPAPQVQIQPYPY